jgi:hypothetical protein
LPLGQRVAAVGVGRPGEHQLDLQPAGAQPPDRGDRVEDPFAAQHAGDERYRDGFRRRLGERREMRGIDP